MTEVVKQNRGFLAMDPEKRREIARKGGAAVNPLNRSFSKDRDLATSAGRKGGQASHGGGRLKVEG
jgi:general stress protein YciG